MPARATVQAPVKDQKHLLKNGRRFGVELEFAGDLDRVTAAIKLQDVEVALESYGHSRSTFWRVITDASVNNGGEVVSPVLQGAGGFEQLRRVTRAMSRAGATVNGSTGLHVHHDVRDLDLDDLKRFVFSYVKSQDAIDELVSPSRRRGRNTYCLRWADHDLDSFMEASQHHVSSRDTRYYTVNPCSYETYGTVEVRQHQGTLSFPKIYAWVLFGQSMIQHSLEHDEPLIAGDAEHLLRTLSPYLSPYMVSRGVDAGWAAWKVDAYLLDRANTFRELIATAESRVAEIAAETDNRTDGSIARQGFDVVDGSPLAPLCLCGVEGCANLIDPGNPYARGLPTPYEPEDEEDEEHNQFDPECECYGCVNTLCPCEDGCRRGHCGNCGDDDA